MLKFRMIEFCVQVHENTSLKSSANLSNMLLNIDFRTAFFARNYLPSI